VGKAALKKSVVKGSAAARAAKPAKGSKAPPKAVAKSAKAKVIAKPAAKPVKPAAKAALVKAVTAKPSPSKSAPAKAAVPAKAAATKVASAKAATEKQPIAKPAVVAAKPAGKGKMTMPAKPAINPSAIILPPGKPGAMRVEAHAPKPVRVEPKPEPYRPMNILEQANSSGDSKPKKNQAGLTTKELDLFRDQLLMKRRELVGDMSNMEKEALQSGDSGLSTLPIHMADMGTDNYEQEFTLGLVEKDRTLLREINHALAKIQNGTYGICEGNGKPISKVRLEAQPWARYSIEYARLQEKTGGIRR
jgi:DnaK suppressor protein